MEKTEQAAACNNSELTWQLTLCSGTTHTSAQCNRSNFCIFTTNPSRHSLYKTAELTAEKVYGSSFFFFLNAEFPLFQENETSSLALPSFIEGVHIYSLVSCFSLCLQGP